MLGFDLVDCVPATTRPLVDRRPVVDLAVALAEERARLFASKEAVEGAVEGLSKAAESKVGPGVEICPMLPPGIFLRFLGHFDPA
jgi:hypothetical protein